jgi:Domain of unknown function (DUF1330)
MRTWQIAAIAAFAGVAAGAAAVTGLNAQATPKAYIVTELDVTGSMEAFQRDYAAHVQATVEPFGGRYIVRGGRSIGVEGETHRAAAWSSASSTAWKRRAPGAIRRNTKRSTRSASAKRSRACTSWRAFQTSKQTARDHAKCAGHTTKHPLPRGLKTGYTA